MKYTLFVDESGDFSRAPRWIVSGVLCEGIPEQAENQLKKFIFHIPRQFNLSSCKDLHLTELRRSLGHVEANNIAKAVFSAADKTGIVKSMLVVKNSRKKGLRESERTYRLMLLDLLALADTALPDGSENQQLEVIVARRQKQGELMSTRDDLLADVVDQIKDAVEAGLAARGLLDRLDANHVKIVPAAESYGLVVADFLANLSYNQHQVESKDLFETLENSGRVLQFEGLGEYGERRARIAERDGDLATSLARWAAIHSEDVVGDNQKCSMVQIWKRVLGRGSNGPAATLEAVLEKLWRQHKETPASYIDLLAQLARLEVTLLEAQGAPQLLYRVRNFIHMVANQICDIKTADKITSLQKEMKENIAGDPSQIHLILDTQLNRITTEEVRLDFEEAVEYAREHCEFVEQYRTLWELLRGDKGTGGFTQSRLWVKARMTLLRTLMLAGFESDQKEIGDLLSSLTTGNLSKSDLSRYDNYKIWASTRYGNLEEAVNYSKAVLQGNNNLFATQFVVRACADAVLEARSEVVDEVKKMLPLLRERTANLSGHPADLISRDMAVLEFHIGRGRKAAVRRLKNSLEITKALPSSPVNSWVAYVAREHLKEISSNVESEKVCCPESAKRLMLQVEDLAPKIGILKACRRVSPY